MTFQRPFILNCLFNGPPGLNVFVGGGNKKKLKKILKRDFVLVGEETLVN